MGKLKPGQVKKTRAEIQQAYRDNPKNKLKIETYEASRRKKRTIDRLNKASTELKIKIGPRKKCHQKKSEPSATKEDPVSETSKTPEDDVEVCQNIIFNIMFFTTSLPVGF